MGLSYADAYATRALLRRGLRVGRSTLWAKKLNRRCDDFCAQLLTFKKIFFGRLAHEDEAWRIAANITKLPRLLRS